MCKYAINIAVIYVSHMPFACLFNTTDYSTQQYMRTMRYTHAIIVPSLAAILSGGGGDE